METTRNAEAIKMLRNPKTARHFPNKVPLSLFNLCRAADLQLFVEIHSVLNKKAEKSLCDAGGVNFAVLSELHATTSATTEILNSSNDDVSS